MSALTQINNVFLLAAQMKESDAESFLEESKCLFPQVKQWHMLVYNAVAQTQKNTLVASSEIIFFTKKDLALLRKRIKKQILKPYEALPIDVLIALHTENIEVFSYLIKNTTIPFKVCGAGIDNKNFNVFLQNKQVGASVDSIMHAVKAFFLNIKKYEY